MNFREYLEQNANYENFVQYLKDNFTSFDKALTFLLILFDFEMIYFLSQPHCH